MALCGRLAPSGKDEATEGGQRGIDAVDFDKKITVTYGGSDITLSVLDFCGIVLKEGSTASAAMQTLAKTLIVYNTNAKAYFG